MTLATWCELRHDCRDFRLDRFSRLRLLDDVFADAPGRTPRDVRLHHGREAVRLLEAYGRPPASPSGWGRPSAASDTLQRLPIPELSLLLDLYHV